jgi:hypothetical protein
MIKRHEQAGTVCAFVSCFAGLAATYLLVSDWSIRSLAIFCIIYVATRLLQAFLNWVAFMHLVKKVYGGDMEALIRDMKTLSAATVTPVNEPITITVTDTSENVVGRFKDTDILEWISIETPDGPKKMYFEGTMEFDEHHQVPVGAIMIPPGIIYQDAR